MTLFLLYKIKAVRLINEMFKVVSQRPKLKRDWEGLTVRLLHEIETNGGCIFPKGTIMRVTRSFGGLHLTYDHACTECRLRHRDFVRRVHESNVEIVEEVK